MSTIEMIETNTAQYAAARDELTEYVTALQTELETVKRRFMPDIKRAVRRTVDERAKLYALIESSPGLFVKPRTITVSGIKVGYTKQKGKVVIDDEAATIKRMREQLPEDQFELLVRVSYSVHKPCVYDLTAGDLKRFGIRIIDDTDAIVINPVDSNVDKLVAALLKEAEDMKGGAE